jgi:hypothetical protein
MKNSKMIILSITLVMTSVLNCMISHSKDDVYGTQKPDQKLTSEEGKDTVPDIIRDSSLLAQKDTLVENVSQTQKPISKPLQGAIILSSPIILRGQRSKTEVLRTALQNLQAINLMYMNRRKEIPELNGVIVGKFIIISTGQVISSEIVHASLNDSILQEKIRNKLYDWHFEKLDISNDTTEVNYPFKFY